jgi:hypothetical protein
MFRMYSPSQTTRPTGSFQETGLLARVRNLQDKLEGCTRKP